MEWYNIVLQSKARGEVEKQKEYIYYYGARTIQKCREKFQNGCKKILEEMKLILLDFFVCDLSEAENALSMRLANGQTFKLTVQEDV